MEPANFTFRALAEAGPGEVWQRYFQEKLAPVSLLGISRKVTKRARAISSARAWCARTSRQLLPTYERLVELAGGGTWRARLLSFGNPPPYLAGVFPGGESLRRLAAPRA